MASPFMDFLKVLGPPTLLNLLLAFLWLGLLFRRSFHASELVHNKVDVLDNELARWARISLVLVAVLTLARIIVTAAGGPAFPLSWIALVSGLPILLFSRSRLAVLHQLDWTTLVFFASMFVLMASVWNSGFFQGLLQRFDVDVGSIPTILAMGVGVSQLISNVPLVALYLPLLQHAGAGAPELLALAAGSTLAGNLLILGAASNVIIIQHAEKHHSGLSFIQFARAGIPLTAINMAVYWAWLKWLY